MSLDYINFIVIKHFPGDTNFDKTTQVRLLWLTLNGFFGEVCLCFLESTTNRTIYHTEGIK